MRSSSWLVVAATSVTRLSATVLATAPPSAGRYACVWPSSCDRRKLTPPYQPSPSRAARTAERRMAPPTQIGTRPLTGTTGSAPLTVMCLPGYSDAPDQSRRRASSVSSVVWPIASAGHLVRGLAHCVGGPA